MCMCGRLPPDANPDRHDTSWRTASLPTNASGGMWPHHSYVLTSKTPSSSAASARPIGKGLPCRGGSSAYLTGTGRPSREGKARDFEQGARVTSTPFTLCRLAKAFPDGFLNGLEEELKAEVPLRNKSNDLFQFKQSDDLKLCDLPHVAALR
jgi:hypothetical protein